MEKIKNQIFLTNSLDPFNNKYLSAIWIKKYPKNQAIPFGT